MVYGLERFEMYTFGQPVTVENDHRPLKTLCVMPKRLQATMMRMSCYDVSLKYQPGNSMVLADTLSRAHPSDTGVPHTHGSFDAINALALMTISDKRIAELQKASAVRFRGWPENKDLLPNQLRLFFDIRDSRVVRDGILMKGERITFLTRSALISRCYLIVHIWGKTACFGVNVNLSSGLK